MGLSSFVGEGRYREAGPSLREDGTNFYTGEAEFPRSEDSAL